MAGSRAPSTFSSSAPRSSPCLSPSSKEGRLPVDERLALRGRATDSAFAANEKLYIRVAFTEDDVVPVSAMKSLYPGSDGMSTNRCKYSLPADVLYPSWSDQQVFGVEVGALPRELEDGSGRSYRVECRHDPVGPPDLSFENYAHSLIVTLREDVEVPGRRVAKAIKTRVRHELARKLVPVDLAATVERGSWRRRALALAGGLAVIAVVVVVALGGTERDQALVPRGDRQATVENAPVPRTAVENDEDILPRPDVSDSTRPANTELPAEEADIVEALAVAEFSTEPDKRAHTRGSCVAAWRRGFSSFRAGDFEAAKAAYEEALSYDDRYVPALSSLGRTNSELGDWDEAFRWYEKALATDSDYVPALLGLSVALVVRRGQQEDPLEALGRAEDLVMKALAIEPGNVQASAMLRRIRKRRGE